MINDDVQKQSGGDESTNVQGKSVTIIHQGISYADAKEIALDVYKANFIKLSEEAGEIAIRRATELTDRFLAELKERSPQSLESMRDPSMQIALYTAQKEYSKSGDKDLESLLIDILVARSVEKERTLQQIVLDESLNVVSKLTTNQLSALSVIFVLTHSRNPNLANLEMLREYLEQYIVPFIDDLTRSDSCFEHLEYAGCGSLLHLGAKNSIEWIFRESYPGLFSKGMSEEQAVELLGDLKEWDKFLMPSLHVKSNLQVNTLDKDALKKLCDDEGVSEENYSKIMQFFNKGLMSEAEVKSCLIELQPKLEHLFTMWTSTNLSKFNLTTVGIALAQANCRHKCDVRFDLSTWVK